LEDQGNLYAGAAANNNFTRFGSGGYELVRDGAFGSEDPTIYTLMGNRDNVTTASYFQVSPLNIAFQNRNATNNYGYVTDVLSLTNFQYNAHGYPLDQIIVGFTNGYYTPYTRRPSTGVLDTGCETPLNFTDTNKVCVLNTPDIEVTYTFPPHQQPGVPPVYVSLNPNMICDYPNIMNGTARKDLHGVKKAVQLESPVVYPNPVQDGMDELTLELPGVEAEQELTITDIFGRVMHTQMIPAADAASTQQIMVSTGHLNGGINLLKLSVDGEVVWSQRVVKE